MTANSHMIPPGVRFSRITPQQAGKLHEGTLKILERTGVQLMDDEALDLMRKAGASVDGSRVRIPPHLVEAAFDTAPKQLAIYNRRGQPAMDLHGYRSYFGSGSDCLHIVDHRDGMRRSPSLRDVIEGTRLGDALPNVDFVMSMFLPTDVNQAHADRHQMAVMLNHTTKPIVFVTYELTGCLDAIEMAEIVAGGADALRGRPFVMCYINVTTGLRHNQEALQKLLFLAGKGLPAMYIPVASAGLAGPATAAGSMAVINAGVLAGLVLSQLKRPGTPFIMPGLGGEMMDMRTMVELYADPDVRGLAPALAHFYGLPFFSLAGGSESKLVDGQAGIEAALTLVVAALTGGHIIHDMGYLESGLSGSLAQLVICDEIVSWIKSAIGEIEVTDETLALDLIDEIGPDGQFLDTPHTLAHFRDRWYPRVFDRSNFSRWHKKDGMDLTERAARRVDKLLADHQPEPLSPEVQQGIQTVLDRLD